MGGNFYAIYQHRPVLELHVSGQCGRQNLSQKKISHFESAASLNGPRRNYLPFALQMVDTPDPIDCIGVGNALHYCTAAVSFQTNASIQNCHMTVRMCFYGESFAR